MTIVARCVLLAGLLACSSAFAAPPPKAPPPPPKPDISEQAIDTADLAGWRARLDALAAHAEATAKAAPKASKKKPAALPARPRTEDPDPFLIRAQILLDRAHASPGAIDGRDGGNLKKAVRAFREMRKLPPGDALDQDVWTALSADAGKPTRVYQITPEDVGGRFEPKLPADYAKLARLKWIAYRTPAEMFAERFHLDERLLRQLNPRVDFAKAGEWLLAPETASPPPPRIARIEVDKAAGELRGFTPEGALALAFPATVGSSDTPSPEGKMTVNGSFPNPHYIYDPKKNFQQGRNKRKLTLPPGPNGPVGSMWIDLSKPTYGIHGAPEPEKIGKSESHGCVRLTNWDAGTLGPLVDKGKTSVEFR